MPLPAQGASTVQLSRGSFDALNASGCELETSSISDLAATVLVGVRPYGEWSRPDPGQAPA
jgi:hypothetical protein